MKTKIIIHLMLSLLLLIISGKSQATENIKIKPINNGVGKERKVKFNNDNELLTYIQKQHFEYMWSGAEPSSGLARVRLIMDDPQRDQDIITVGGSGFGVAGIIVG